MQVAAFADGRSAVHEYDCLLLEFVLGQRPDDAHVRLVWALYWVLGAVGAAVHAGEQGRSLQCMAPMRPTTDSPCTLVNPLFAFAFPLPQKVKAFLLETIASDPGLQQTELVFLGLFGRACRVLEAANAQVGGSTS